MRREVRTMVSIQTYDSPIGTLLLAADEVGLCGLWLAGEKQFADHLPAEHVQKCTPVLINSS